MTGIKTYTAVAILLLATSAQAALDTRFLQGLGDSEYQLLSSEVVDRDYHLYVMLPAGYADQPQQDYATVYLLDGGGLYPLIVAYYRYLRFGDEVPDVIIVGISYGADTFEDGNYRSTDYTAASVEREYWGGAENFQKVLQDEVIPLVENQYRSRPDRRVIFGHSLGGQFVLYTAQTKPDLFWGHLASNPALHRNLPFFLQPAPSASNTLNQPKLFVGAGANDNPRFREPARKWIAHWSAINAAPWQLQIATLDGHSHMSTPPAVFRQGIQWLFAGAQH